jgi:hypothetical protein
LDETYVPSSWLSAGAAAVNAYQIVFQPNCRTCHVALSPSYDFDTYSNAVGPVNQGVTTFPLCSFSAGSVNDVLRVSQAMPNSLVTFNNLWSTVGTSADPSTALAGLYNPNFKCLLGEGAP